MISGARVEPGPAGPVGAARRRPARGFGRSLRARRPPRRGLRWRLALFYGTLVFVSGLVLLAVTFLLLARQPLANETVSAVPETVDVGPSAVPRLKITPSGLIHAGSVSERLAVLHGYLIGSGFLLVLLAALSVWLGWLMAGRALDPLRAITATTRQISAESLHRRLALGGPRDEVRELGDTIDGLLARLEGAFDAQRSFVANASHELRTPLTAMRVAIDVAMRKPRPPSEDATKLASRVRAELDEADRILESLLVLARAQRDVTTEFERVSLRALAAAALEAERGPARARGITLRAALGDAEVTGHATLLARMASNLVDNAVRHNEPGGFVELSVERNGSRVRMRVQNGGPPLDQATVGQLTQPFRRLGAERTGSANGVGLGLSIVEAIVAAHGGSLELAARAEGGLAVTVELPAAA